MIQKICFAILTVIFLSELGFKLYSKSNITDPTNPVELKVMTYNLFFKNKYPNNSIDVIKESNPDVLFVQELTPTWAANLEAVIGKSYPYKLIKPLKGTHGIGIYSKYQLTDQLFLNNASNKPFAQAAVLHIEHRKIKIINTHLASPAVAIENKEQFFSLYRKNYKLRKKQVEKISNLSKDHSNKHHAQILIGDLNTMKYEPLFKRLKFRWADAHSISGRGLGFNFPHSLRVKPFITLDYILGKGEIDFIETKVLKGGSSDHLAIISKLKI